MQALERALRTAEAQIEEAEATARIRNAYFTIIVSNAQALFGLFRERDKRTALSQALEDRNSDSSMLHRGLILQVNAVFENFIRSVCGAVLKVKTRRVQAFSQLDERIKREYIHRSAVVLTRAKEGNILGRSFDFEGLQSSLAVCILDAREFEIKAEVFTVLMGNCTSDRLSNLFEALCLTDPFDDRIGSYAGLRRCSKEKSNRKVANFAKRTLDERSVYETILRMEI